MFVGDKDGAVAMMEHPEPPVRLTDPLMPVSSEASAVPAISRALIRLVCAVKGFRLAERVDQRALADLQAQQVAQHMAQSRRGIPERSADTERTKARRFGPNGDPGSNPAGGSALKRLAQHGQSAAI